MIDKDKQATRAKLFESFKKLKDRVTIVWGRTLYDKYDETRYKISVRFQFMLREFGFGEFIVVRHKDGSTYIDGEGQSREFLLGLFKLLLDTAILDSDTDYESHIAYNKAMGRICNGHCKICHST